MFISGVGAIGTLQKALSGLVLHYGEGGSSGRPCEVAWLAISKFKAVNPPPVKVFVSPSSLNTMRRVYAPLGNHVQVEPLYFTETELDAAAFLSMMAVGSSESAPLYIQILLVSGLFKLLSRLTRLSSRSSATWGRTLPILHFKPSSSHANGRSTQHRLLD